MENKPVKCGCGGEPVVGHIETSDRWYIGCPDCDICTWLYNTEAEAITAWNKAIGERTAKVESRKWRKDLTLIGGGFWSGKCQECGRWVKSNECTYCPSCGARLEWE